MILTKDNLLRFVRDKKAVTPTMVADVFETTTMIASAALSELAKDNLVAITHLKLSSSPYYYDINQKEILIEIGLKHYGKYEKDVLEKLKDKEILVDNALSIQERLAIEKIKDFAIPLTIEINSREIKFWIWFLRDINKTKKQIIDGVNESSKTLEKNNQADNNVKKTELKSNYEINNYENKNEKKHQHVSKDLTGINTRNVVPEKDLSKRHELKTDSDDERNIEIFIDNFFRNNYLAIDIKQKNNDGVFYSLKLKASKIEVEFDAFYYYKKPTQNDVIQFYTSSLKPKIIFVRNCPKIIYKFAEGVPNITIVNI